MVAFVLVSAAVGLTALPIGGAYAAKILCSALFVSGRDPGPVIEQDLAKFFFVDTEIDRAAGEVHGHVRGLGRRTAIFRERLGCTLLLGADADADALRQVEAPPAARATAHLRWPTGDRSATATIATVDRPAMDAAVDAVFGEPNPGRPRRTRAVVVVHRGRIVAERYADGFSADMPLLGWSMAKSVIAALVGVLVHRGQLALESPASIEAWAVDARGAITVDQLLRMSSGLEFDERYGPFNDATAILFEYGDAAAFAIAKPLEAPADTRWSYSGGSTNILSRVIRDVVADDRAYLALPRTALFDPIGMRSALIESDASGNLIGSSFAYATARDWARFGLLFLNDGVWEGTRLFPVGWSKYVSTPTPTDHSAGYGAHFWLNADPVEGARRFPSLPADTYYANGYEGQVVVIIPSRDLVVVRLGLAQFGGWGAEAFVASVIEAISSSDRR